MDYRDVSTQDELDEAIADGVKQIYLRGFGWFAIYGSVQVTAYGSAQVRAYNSAQVTAYGSAQVRAYGSAQVTAYGSVQVTAYGSVQVRAYGSVQVRAYDSAQVTAYGSVQVRAYDSAQVTAYGSVQVRAYGSVQVRAYGSVQVMAYDSVQVTAYGSVQVTAASTLIAVTIHGTGVRCDGGTIIRVPPIKSVVGWLARYGVKRSAGCVTLYKAVSDNYGSNHNGFPYTPGSTPIAPDWDSGEKECGGGLHFSPTPGHALRFHPEATRFIACPVAVADMRCPRANDDYPDKIKARGCCAPVWEVDINGDAIGETK